MPKVTQAHRESRRSQILNAACKCFSDNGFQKTTTRDICRAAGLSAGAVYAYFKSKEDILEAVAEVGRRNTRAQLKAARGTRPAPEVLADLLRTAVAAFDTEESQLGLRLDVGLWGEALHTPRIRALFERALPNACAPFADIVREGQSRGEIAPHLDADAVARLTVALCLGLQVQKALVPDISIARTADAISALLKGSFATNRSGR